MNTAFLLMARYNAMPVIPAETVRQDFFPHLSKEVFLRKAATRDIGLPLVRTDVQSQKGARGVHLQDLADYIDKRREAARKEVEQLALV